MDEDEEEPLDALDLPQLYQKPSASSLLSTLSDLRSVPLSWDFSDRTITKPNIRPEGIPQYLTRIIASPLQWLADDETRERIWQSASQRLSERSGRTAMGALTRKFTIPSPPAPPTPTSPPASQPPLSTATSIELTLTEPTLTGDNLGLKTWASSYLLSLRLSNHPLPIPSLPPTAQILELGSGTGLVGLSAACIFQRHVILTDLPEILPNLRQNLEQNVETLSECGASAEAAVLDWTHPCTLFLASGPASSSSSSSATPTQREAHSFPLILAADPIYSPDHPGLLVQTVDRHLTRDERARVVVELPLREAYGDERRELRSRLEEVGLGVVEEGEEVGFDDWSDGSGRGNGRVEVRCWWSVWGWR